MSSPTTRLVSARRAPRSNAEASAVRSNVGPSVILEKLRRATVFVHQRDQKGKLIALDVSEMLRRGPATKTKRSCNQSHTYILVFCRLGSDLATVRYLAERTFAV
jgi:hypothetical protein